MNETARYVEMDLPTLLELVSNSDVKELELQGDGMRLRLHRAGPFDLEGGDTGSQVELEEAPPSAEVCTQVTSPLVGVFYRSAEPGTSPFVNEGSTVEESTVVGIIEALEDIPTEVEAGCSGEILRTLVDDGQAVEYGQLLFEMRPRG